MVLPKQILQNYANCCRAYQVKVSRQGSNEIVYTEDESRGDSRELSSQKASSLYCSKALIDCNLAGAMSS
jgi:hypothetical protein